MAPSSSPLSSQTPARIADLDLEGARAATADCPAPLPAVPAYRQAGRLQVLQTAVIEAGLMVGLAALALAVRLPDYMLIPPFTDELDEVYRGYLITQGKLYPLTNVDSYMGSLWNWMAAGALWVSGFRLGAPRTLVLILGVLAVLATYLLGRAWGGRRGGLVAA